MYAVQGRGRGRKWFSTFHPLEVSARLRLVMAFAAVYVVWGSTYLAIRVAIETLPPFFMAGVRFVIAGTLLYTWTRWRGAPRPARIHWREAAIVGGLMLLGGNGSVTWAEQHIPSGLTALLVSTVPLWMVVLERLRPGGSRPSGLVVVGLGLGLVGIVLLIEPGNVIGSQPVDPLGTAVLLIAALLWAAGSLYSRQARLPAAPLQGVGMEMLAGGVWLLLAAAINGDWGRLSFEGVSSRSVLALGYLVVFGSIVGFTTYLWLLRATTPARVGTYAYVNPVVAVFLGWALASEPLTGQTLLAAAVILAAVALITSASSRH